MMDLYSNACYMEDLLYTCNLDLPWDKLREKSIVLSGATGLIGSFFVDVILKKNEDSDLNCAIYALSRNRDSFLRRFNRYSLNPKLVYIPCDVQKPLELDIDNADFVIHLASNTHPALYATDPIGTISTNVIGLQNLLDFSVNHNTSRFVFASSNEIYGENRGDVELFEENYCGYINCNTLRAAYPESKRCGEALCQAFKYQKNLDVIIMRFTRSYGPTMKLSNTRALSQFILNGVQREDVVLKSSGTQYFSYTYMADAVSGLLFAMLNGKNGEAYNVADEGGDIFLRDLAQMIAELNGKQVVFEAPDAVEEAGYSKATKARLDGSKLQLLGWKPRYDIKTGIHRTISILQEIHL